MWFNQTYDFPTIAAYAHGVKPELNLIYYFPSLNANGNYTLYDQSRFVRSMHALNLTVIPFTLADDKVNFGDNDSIQTKSVVIKGVDGIYSDYVSGTLRVLSLIGSQSKLFRPELPIDLLNTLATFTQQGLSMLFFSYLVFTV